MNAWIDNDGEGHFPFDERGVLIASNYDEEGLRANGLGLAFISRAFQGETVFIPPHDPEQLARTRNHWGSLPRVPLPTRAPRSGSSGCPA